MNDKILKVDFKDGMILEITNFDKLKNKQRPKDQDYLDFAFDTMAALTDYLPSDVRTINVLLNTDTSAITICKLVAVVWLTDAEYKKKYGVVQDADLIAEKTFSRLNESLATLKELKIYINDLYCDAVDTINESDDLKEQNRTITRAKELKMIYRSVSESITILSSID